MSLYADAKTKQKSDHIQEFTGCPNKHGNSVFDPCGIVSRKQFLYLFHQLKHLIPKIDGDIAFVEIYIYLKNQNCLII